MIQSPAVPTASTSARELRGQAFIVATIMWALFVVDVTSPSPFGRLSGRIVGTDFVQFSAVSRQHGQDDWSTLPAPARQSQQLRLVPESEADMFPPVYPAQVGLLLQPLASLGYRQAYMTWTIVSLLLYAGSLRLWLGLSPRLRPHAGLIHFGSQQRSPPHGSLALHGQLSMLALLSLALSCVALSRGGHSLAGAALSGLLAFKPSLLLPAVIVCAMAGEWRLVPSCVGVAQFAATISLSIWNWSAPTSRR